MAELERELGRAEGLDVTGVSLSLGESLALGVGVALELDLPRLRLDSDLSLRMPVARSFDSRELSRSASAPAGPYGWAALAAQLTLASLGRRRSTGIASLDLMTCRDDRDGSNVKHKHRRKQSAR